MSKTYPVKVDNCDGCPAIHYKAKGHIECGQPYCKKEKRDIEDEEHIPEWCPLSVWHGESKSDLSTLIKEVANNKETVIAAGPEPQFDAEEPRYSVRITGPQRLLSRLVDAVWLAPREK